MFEEFEEKDGQELTMQQWLNMWFFGETEVALHDWLWFYGVIVVMIGAGLFVIGL